MKKILPKKIFLFLSLCLFFTTESKTQNNTTALMPMVNSVITEKGKPFEMTEKVTLYYNSPELIFTAAQLQQCFRNEWQSHLKHRKIRRLKLNCS